MEKFGKRWMLGPSVLGALMLMWSMLPPRVGYASPRELQQLQQAALRTAQLDTASTTQLRARLHLAPLLPALRVTLGRGWQVAYSGRTQDGLTEPTVDGDRFSYAVTAHWDLAKLLVPHEELSLFRDQPRRAQLRQQVLMRVAKLWALRCQHRHHPATLAALTETLEVVTGLHSLPELPPSSSCPVAPFVDGEHRSANQPRASSTGSAEPPSPDVDLEQDLPSEPTP